MITQTRNVSKRVEALILLEEELERHALTHNKELDLCKTTAKTKEMFDDKKAFFDFLNSYLDKLEKHTEKTIEREFDEHTAHYIFETNRSIWAYAILRIGAMF